MTVCAIIAEYNPFHNGHLYQIQEIKKQFNTCQIVVIMSGSFVQRGQSAIINKYDRAKLAIENGVNLVIELPSYYSLQSAKYFAQGAVSILDSLNVIDYLVFGSESENKMILNTSKTIYSNQESYNENVKKYLKLGNSYVVSTRLALKDLGLNASLGSNDILALEYTNALRSSDIKTYSILRKGQKYLSTEKSNSLPSASYIREELKNNNLPMLEEDLPENIFKYLEKNAYKESFNENYLNLLKYKVFVEEKSFDSIISFEKGMDNLIKKNLIKSDSIESLIERSTSARYTRSRISRLILAYLLEMEKIKEENNYNYIRPLAFDKEGIKVLNLIKNKSNLPIISKFSNYYNDSSNPILDLEVKASNLYNLNKGLVNEDFFVSPFYSK